MASSIGTAKVDPIYALESVHKELSTMQNTMKEGKPICPNELKQLMSLMDNCSSQTPASFSASSVTPNPDQQLVKNILQVSQFFQTSKTAQEALAPSVIDAFLKSLAKLKSGLKKVRQAKKKVERVSNAEKGTPEDKKGK